MGVTDTGRNSKRFVSLLLLAAALLPFVSIPIVGSQFYFRHDDSGILLWAKEYTGPLHHIFSTDPELNRVAYYPGPAGTWRPFFWLYVKVMWHLFGSSPAPYFIIAGLMFVAAGYFIFKFTEGRSGALEGMLACLLLFAAFHKTMYNLFHIGVPVSHFFQIATIWMFVEFRRKRDWRYLFGVALLLGPAMMRQTTAVILAVVFALELLESRDIRSILSARGIVSALLVLAGFFLLSLTPSVGRGSILSAFPDIKEIAGYMYARYLYYGGILTRGVAGILVLFTFSCGLLHNLSLRATAGDRLKRYGWVWFPASILVTLLFYKLGAPSVFWLTLCFALLFLTDPALRLPLAWAGASLLSYFSVDYYHGGYLLEAGFPMAAAMGIIAGRILPPLVHAYGRLSSSFAGRRAIAIHVIVVMLAVAAVFTGARTRFFRDRLDIVRISIESNRNFKNLIGYMKDELPPDCVVYELSESETGTTSGERRFLPLKERAATVKIMNVRDTAHMLKVLGRGDIELLPSMVPPPIGRTGGSFFIALNSSERRIAENLFELVLIEEFKSEHDSAALYMME